MKRVLFDTSALVDYIHEENVARDVFALANGHGQGYVSREDIARIHNASDKYRFKILTCSRATVQCPLALLEYCHSSLGKNAVTNSLLIASGMSLGAILITKDKKWKECIESSYEREGKSNLK